MSLGLSEIDVTAAPYGAACDATAFVDNGTGAVALDGTADDVALQNALYDAYARCPVFTPAGYSMGGVTISVPRPMMLTRPFRIERPGITFVMPRRGNFHATSSLPACAFVMNFTGGAEPAWAVGHATDSAKQAEGTTFHHVSIVTRRLGAGVPVLRTYNGAFTINGGKFHALYGAQPGAVPIDADGIGLQAVGQIGQFHAGGGWYAGGYGLALDLQQAAGFDVSRVRLIGNRAGVRFGWTGGMNGWLSRSVLQDNVVANVLLYAGSAVTIERNWMEYGALPGAANIQVGGHPDHPEWCPTATTIARNYFTGNGNPDVPCYDLVKARTVDISSNHYGNCPGPIIRYKAGDVDHARVWHERWDCDVPTGPEWVAV